MGSLRDTKNIKFVAYLRLHGFHAEKIEKISRGKARYFFKITDEQWTQYKLDFDKSPEFKYAQSLEAVADLAY